MKTAWLSALSKDEDRVKKVMAQMKTYGLEVKGHFWQNNNAAMAWTEALREMLAAGSSMWLIMGNRADLDNKDIRYGLSLLSLGLQAAKGSVFPIAVLQSDAPLITADGLPDPLKRALIVATADSGAPAKLVARAHAVKPEIPQAYTIEMVGNTQFGQWFEIKPTRDAWPGIIFGVDDGAIRFQAVGPSGKLPDKTTLEYPMQGLTIELSGREYTAWAVRNTISPENSYYVKVDGSPGCLLLGSYSEDAQAEMYVLHLT